MKKWIKKHWENILLFALLIFFVSSIYFAILFAINSENVKIVEREPAWLEWERAYGRQGF